MSNINRDLTNSTRLGQQVNRITALIEDHLQGLSRCEDCNSEIKPFHLSKTDLDLFKIVFNKTVSDIKDEDFADATDEPKTRDEVYQSTAAIMADKAFQCRDQLIELLVNISTISTEPVSINIAHREYW